MSEFVVVSELRECFISNLFPGVEYRHDDANFLLSQISGFPRHITYRPTAVNICQRVSCEKYFEIRFASSNIMCYIWPQVWHVELFDFRIYYRD